jgi:hypothetical protein
MYVLCMYVCMFVCMLTCRVTTISVLLHDDTVCSRAGRHWDPRATTYIHTYIHTYRGCVLVEVPTGLRDITYTYRFHFVLGLVQLKEILMSTLRDDPPP